MNDVSDATPAQLQDPDFDLPMGPRVTLGLQHAPSLSLSLLDYRVYCVLRRLGRTGGGISRKVQEFGLPKSLN